MSARDCTQSQSRTAGCWLKGECDREVSSHLRPRGQHWAPNRSADGRNAWPRSSPWTGIAQPANSRNSCNGARCVSVWSAGIGLPGVLPRVDSSQARVSFLRCLTLLRSGEHLPLVSYKSCAVSSNDAFPRAYLLRHSSVTTSAAVNLIRYCC
jgi:hypothetical protein